MRLEDFLSAHRAAIIERCRIKVASRGAPKATEHELERGIPRFLDHLIDTLRVRIAEVSLSGGGPSTPAT